MLTNEEYLQACFQAGITKTTDIVSKLEAEILSLETELSVELQNLKNKKMYCEQLKQLRLRFSPKKKNIIPEEGEEELSAEAQAIFCKIIAIVAEDKTFSLRPGILANCLSLELNDVYYALKHLQAVQILMRDAEQNILPGPQWENRNKIYPFLHKND
jgi:hypothetical protein